MVVVVGGVVVLLVVVIGSVCGCRWLGWFDGWWLVVVVGGGGCWCMLTVVNSRGRLLAVVA